MKYLIVGLGNIGDGYEDTRHNIGFMVLDTMAEIFSVQFEDKRYGAIARLKYKGREFILLKPSTFMNLSGNAVRFWMKKEKIPIEKLLVIVDDIALLTGNIRMRSKGGDGGHNGLAHINNILASNEYSRIRIGIGDGFNNESRVNYVLGRWTTEEKKIIGERITLVTEMIKSFGMIGTELTMTAYNKAGKIDPDNKS